MERAAIGIHGVGAVTGYGWGRAALWRGLRSGLPAGGWVDGYGPQGGPGWVIRVPPGGDPDDGPSRFARAMRSALREAVGDARDRGWRPGERVGLLHATVLGEVELWREFYLAHGGRRRVRDYLAMMPSTPVAMAMREFGFHGPAMTVSAMCASGNAALVTATSWLERGIADDVVIVATDLSCTPENTRHFVDLGVAVTDEPPLQACRPFQADSRGFPVAEAAIAFVVSGRAGRPYSRVLGGAMSHDAFHATSIDPDLEQVMRCVREALDDAGVDPRRVGYLNAHGPGTAQCDTAEATVLETLLPAHARVYGVKPLVGHCQAAAAAAEVAVAALGYEHGLLPAPPAVSAAHPQLLHGPQPVEPLLTVKTSLGMGGHNSAVVLGPA